ncbi:MAG: ATP-binding protein [Candidatus Marinimicrobia bacterium]|nr:ATP-binding protein [Candidatus Neomarinimicrobiota bacterium]
MNKEKIKQLIVEHKERFLKPADLVRRDSQSFIEKVLKQKEIIVISGVRRAGKSSLMKLITGDLINQDKVPGNNILYLNFEDERFIEFKHSDFEILLETYVELYQPDGRQYFFLDEIQNIKGWEKWVNRLYEFENIKIFITGSNASLLSSEIASALTGRNRQILNFPFSFHEFLSFNQEEIKPTDFYLREKKIKLKKFFQEYASMGGFPEVLKNRDLTLLEQYFKDIIYRDVIARYNIRNIHEIRELALFLASNIGTIQSYQNLQNLINVKSLNTIKNYLEIFESVYLFLRVDLFDFSVKRQIYNPSKIYITDIALANSIAFTFSRNIGRLYENIVCIELMRRNQDIFYWKSKNNQEVDFLIKKGLEINTAIQVCTSLSNDKIKKREIESLLEAKRTLNARNLIILTEDEEDEITENSVKINITPIWKWLLE